MKTTGQRAPTMPPPSASKTKWRLAYAAMGWYTFLVHGVLENGQCTCHKPDCKAVGKHPIFVGTIRGATVDTTNIRREGLKYPHANVGLHLGLSNLVCIDVDPRNGGNETLARLEEVHGSLNAGIVAETGGGGRHYLFRPSEDLPSGKNPLGAGIDFLHGSYYPVIAPSKHVSGTLYKWAFDSDPWSNAWLLSPIPAWMAELGPIAPKTTRPLQGGGSPLASSGSYFQKDGDVADLTSALSVIPADERDVWFRMGAALHHASNGSSEGRQLWDEWSLGSSIFEGCAEKFCAEDQEQVWLSFKADLSSSVTVGSIFFEARKRGWQPSRSNAGPDTLGDISNGRLFAERHSGEFLFVKALAKWLRWDGLHWTACSAGEDVQAAKALADSLVRDAGAAFTANPDDANKRRHGLALAVHRSLPRLHAILNAASTEPRMSVPDLSAFDSDPLLVGVRNGVLDLRTGTLLQPQPDQLVSKLAGACFVPGATCPRWNIFLREVFGNDDIVAFVQRLVGYTLTGLVDEEILLFLFGMGANGKSVFANVLAALLGDYAVAVGTELLARNKSESETARYKAKLQGARLALANEVGQADTWDDQRIKEVTSRELIPARMLYGEPYSFMPTHKLWIRGNHQPTILDASDGMWRRLVLIPFVRQFTTEERIPDLDRQLIAEELDGILAWATLGCADWLRKGLSVPSEVSFATAQYRSESDVVAQWLEESCERKLGKRLDVREAYGSWQSFCLAIGISPGSQPRFTRKLRSTGILFRKSNGRGFFSDLSLRMPPFDDL